ncbi:MAG TPA: c-type cytochrome [Longimicrobiales bacterium]|nr:c-type cytochrome [Longimicrobiales bacterium]
MMIRRTPLFAALLALAACGGDAPPAQTPSGSPSGGGAAPSAAELTTVELEQGLGPIRDLQLGAVDPALAETGEAAFVMKCSACHKIEERYIGPELGTVLSRRRPEFVMNQMLNATEMVQRHPVIKDLLAQYYTPMPVQVTDHDEARAILEYLRSAQTAAPSTSNGSAGGQ